MCFSLLRPAAPLDDNKIQKKPKLPEDKEHGEGNTAHKGPQTFLEGGGNTDLEEWPQCPGLQRGHVSWLVTESPQRHSSPRVAFGHDGRDASAPNKPRSKMPGD